MDENNFKSFSKIIRVLFFIICMTGCLFQIYKISEIYFLYETTTDVRRDEEADISFPALTICIDKLDFIKQCLFSYYL